MAVRLNTEYLKGFVKEQEISNMKHLVSAAHAKLNEGASDKDKPKGWLTLPFNYDKEEFERIKAAASKIQKTCQVFIVVGIGGSYLGARAAIEFVKGTNYNKLAKDTPEIYFLGNSIDGDEFADVLEICKDKDICLNVISKSGTTTEPGVAFRILRNMMIEKYGDKYNERVFITTDKKSKPGTLKEFADKSNIETFVVPDDIGGRYSVLSAVGLLPIAVSGCDIDKMMEGARDAAKAFEKDDLETNDCYRYAALRNILYNKGKEIEILASYSQSMHFTAEWYKQLFAESEGKDGKGIFPTSLIYSTDLHSLGQFVQDGKRNLFETVVDIKASKNSITVPEDEANIDGLNFLSGKSLHYVNSKAFLGTILAHTKGGVPNMILEIDALDEYNFGFMVFFFEKACAIDGYILGINPFDQPGVEEYKKNMFSLLGKPGYEQIKL